MKYFILLIFIILSLPAVAQQNNRFIDHDFKWLIANGLYSTDSINYYVHSGPSSHSSFFSSIDNEGAIDRKLLHQHNWGIPKFYEHGKDSLTILYYNTFDYDHYRNHIIEHRFYNGEHEMIKNRPIGINCDDVHISKSGDLLTILNGDDTNDEEFPESNLLFFDSTDILLQVVELEQELEYHKLLSTNKDKVLLLGKNNISILNDDYNLEDIYQNGEEIKFVIDGENDNVFLFFNDRVSLLNLQNFTDTQLFNYDFTSLVMPQYHEGNLFLYFQQNSYQSILSIAPNASNETLWFEKNDYDHDLYFHPSGNKLNVMYQDRSDVHINPVFESISNPSSPYNDCVNLSLDSVNLFRFNTTEFSTYHFEISFQVTNNGTETVEFFDLHSSPTYPYSIGGEFEHYTYRGYDLAVNETLTVVDTFLADIWFPNPPEYQINFVVPGGDHRLDCFPEDNTNFDSEIMTTIIKIEKSKIAIYPNPTDGLINIVGLERNFDYAIIDTNGRTVLENKYNGPIDISFLNNGIFFIRVDNKVYKLIKI